MSLSGDDAEDSLVRKVTSKSWLVFHFGSSLGPKKKESESSAVSNDVFLFFVLFSSS